MNEETGLVSYIKNENFVGPLAEGTIKLMQAIDNPTINVNVDAWNSPYTTANTVLSGGAFMGNKVNTLENKLGNFKLNFVEAYQEINPHQLETIGNYNDNIGVGILHEVTEAYEGALISQETGISAERSIDGKENLIYDEAHRKATPQNADIKLTYYDSRNREVDGPTPGGRLKIFLQDPNKQGGRVVPIVEVPLNR